MVNIAKFSSACIADSTVWNIVFMYSCSVFTMCVVVCRSEQRAWCEEIAVPSGGE